MEFNRVFTSNFNIENIEYIKIPCEIKDEQGNIVFSCQNLEVPANWSISAIENVVQRHFVKQKIVPTILKKVHEDNLPLWLQRNIADTDELALLQDTERFSCETSIKQLINRIALSWTYNGYKNKYFETEDTAKIFYEEMFYILINQIALPSTIQMTHQGLYWAYGISNDLSYYFVPQLDNNTYENPAVSTKEIVFSSFILSTGNSGAHDDGIIQLLNNESKLFSCSIGSCTNYSSVRSKNEINKTGVYASGVLNFVQLSDKLANTIKTTSPNYNISKLAILNDNHPDILDFVYWKVKAEQQMVSLITGSQITHKILGYVKETCNNFNDKNDLENNLELKKDLFLAQSLKIPAKFIRRILSMASNEEQYFDFQTYANSSEYYNNFVGYNTSLSIRLSNDFLNNVRNDDLWSLTSVITSEETKSISSSWLMNQICYASWVCAEPSIQFDTTINQWNTCQNSGYIRASSLNEDYMFLDNTSSPFANIDLLHFRKDDGTFNVEKFSHVVKLLITAQDILFFMALYPNEITAKETMNYRPLSIGYCNFAAYLMSIGIPYASDKARAMCSAITSLLTGYSYIASSMIAAKLGYFPKYKENETSVLNTLHNHKEAANSGSNYKGLTILPTPFNKHLCDDIELSNKAVFIWNEVVDLCIKHGLRNAQVTSLSLKNSMEALIENVTSSVMPSLGIMTNKKNIDGKYTKQIIPVAIMGLKTLNYNEQHIDEIIKYMCGYHTLNDCPYINEKSLMEKGFTKEILNKIEDLISDIFNIEFLFNHYILGEDFCVNVLNLNLDDFKDPNVSLLQKIGFTKEQITAANKYVTGYGTMVGAPYLKEEHINVFDGLLISANNNNRYINHTDQIKMISAAQSFISGAVSHIVVLPVDSHISDFSSSYLLAWQSGIKTIRLYREGFKLSQILHPDLIQDKTLTNIDLLKKVKDELIPDLLYNSKVIKNKEGKGQN